MVIVDKQPVWKSKGEGRKEGERRILFLSVPSNMRAGAIIFLSKIRHTVFPLVSINHLMIFRAWSVWKANKGNVYYWIDLG